MSLGKKLKRKYPKMLFFLSNFNLFPAITLDQTFFKAPEKKLTVLPE